MKEARPMTPDEVRMALALGACRFSPGTFAKRFAGQTAANAVHDQLITDKGAAFLRKLVWSYRRQIPAAVVALAGPPVVSGTESTGPRIDLPALRALPWNGAGDGP